MDNEKEKFENVSDETSLEEIFRFIEGEDDDEPTLFGFSCDEEKDEDDFPCVLTSNQLFSQREVSADFSKVCDTVDERGCAFIIKNDELRYAVISFDDYKKFKRDQSNYYEEQMISRIAEEMPLPPPEKSAEDDPLICDVLESLKSFEGISTSFLQRKFKIGYGRAARIIDYLECNDLVSPYNGSKPREVLVTKEQIDEAIAELKK